MGSKVVPRKQYLWKRGGTYYLRRRVPTHLVPWIGSKEITRSLRTSNYQEARRLADYEVGHLQLVFELLEAQTSDYQGLSEQQIAELSFPEIRAIVRDWFEQSKRDLQAKWSAGATGCTEDNDDAEMERDDELARVEERLRNSGNADAAKDVRDARVVAHNLLIQTGAAAVPRRSGRSGAIELVTSPRADVDVQSGSFQYLVQCTRDAQRELLRLHRSILKGTDLDVPQSPVLQSHGLTLNELIDAFLSDPRMQGVSAKRRIDYAMVFRVLREAWGGERRVRDLSREDFRTVRRLVLSIPKNSTKIYPGMSFRDAANRASERGLPLLNPKTVATHLQKISTLFKWAENEDYIDRNLARGLADPGSSAHSDEDRHPFTVEELKRIFSGPPFVRGQEKSNRSGSIESGQGGARYWVPLISLFHGMRLNEICQLRVNQIKQQGEIIYIDIQASTADQRLKTPQSRRRIPVHPMVARLGFLRYVSELRKRNADRLFPELPVDARGYYSRKITRWFSSHVERCGVDTERKSFHSLRHAWRDAAREARIPEEIVKVLGGWAREGTASRYGSGYSVELLSREIAKIEFRGLHLEHLIR